MLAYMLSVALVLPSDGIWGDVGMGFYPASSEKVAPNGLVYDPMFKLDADLNIGTSNFYIFANSVYYTEKPQPGVTTNKNQGKFDFTKRQYDFNIGFAWGTSARTELRLFAYSQSNINRGQSLDKPYGFKDGAAFVLRYYPSISREKGYLGAGYYFTKDLADTGGQAFEPGLFSKLNYGIFLYKNFRIAADAFLVTEKGFALKELDSKLGLIYRLRNNGSKSEVSLSFEKDFGLQDTPERDRWVIEYKKYFSGK
jgi:hypothetical protein